MSKKLKFSVRDGHKLHSKAKFITICPVDGLQTNVHDGTTVMSFCGHLNQFVEVYGYSKKQGFKEKRFL